MAVGTYAWFAVVFGRLAFVGALLTLVLAFRRKQREVRANLLLVSVAVLVGSIQYVFPLSRLAYEVTGAALFVLTIVMLWRLVRAVRALGE